MKRTIIAFLLAICLIAGHIPPMAAYAADGTSIGDASNINMTETEQADDGLALRIEGENTEDFYGFSTFSRSNDVTHNVKFDGYEIQHGIDISHHNNYGKNGLWKEIDWNKVKAAGIDFAIIRTAYRGYGKAGNMLPDNQYAVNIKNAQAAGLEVGVYFFSQAITKDEAIEEANYILNQIKGYDLELPVVLDFEYTAKSEGGRLWAAKLTDRQRTNICMAFCDTVKAAGYDTMIYANREMLTKDLYSAELTAAGHKTWLAEWGKSASYEGDYTYWQYTSDGSVDGVPSTRVDMNYRYIEPSVEASDRTHDTITLTWDAVTGAEGYYVYRKGADGGYIKIADITEPGVLTYTDTGLEMKTEYSYKVMGFKTEEDGTVTEFEDGYYETSGVTSVQLAPASVKGTAVDAGSTKLSWPAVEYADGYEVQYYNNSKKAYVTIADIEASQEAEYTHSGLKAGLKYSYRVMPYAIVGEETVCGNWSEKVSVRTSTKLTKPVLTAKQYSYTTNKLSWDRVPGATGYQVQKYNSSKKKYTTIKTVKSGSTCAYSNTYLNSGTTYKYRVRAYATVSGKKVYSSYSSVKSCKTKGSRIGKVTASKLTVRTGASTKYKKLTSVKKNRKLTITGSREGWYRIKIKVNGKYKTGYVSKKYVKLQK